MNQEERIIEMAKIMVAARRANEDVGTLVAAALHGAAFHFGEAAYLVQGRPGSWEADILLRMARAGGTGNPTRIEQLMPLFIEMGKTKEDGGDVLSCAMSQAVDILGGLREFAGNSSWFHDLVNIGKQYSQHCNDPIW